MTTNLEKVLLQLGVVKTADTNVGIATTTFKVINPNNLCSYTNTGVTTTASYNSAEAANDYLNSVEWRKPDGTISMSPSDFGVSSPEFSSSAARGDAEGIGGGTM